MTCELEPWFVVHVIVAEVVVMAVAVTAVMVGATAVVVKVELPEVAVRLALLVETTSKSYVVPGVSPVNVTEWAVTKVLFTPEFDP